MGIMRDFLLQMQWIEELYDVLAEDADVQELHLYPSVLKAAKEVLDTPSGQMPTHDMDLVEYALLGATYDLENKRAFWAEHNLRQRSPDEEE
jgi:hypothetical protein